MRTLPSTIIPVLQSFAPVFGARVWERALSLLVGAILAPGQRTVTAILRILGRSQERHFQNYHRVLNRAHWSSRALSRILLGLLLAAFVPGDEPVVVGLDETIERRRGAKIAAKGIYRDPVRSSKTHFVKTSGLRWVSLQLLAEIPWAERVWALPFLTALAPSARYHQTRGRRHKKLTDWGRQLIRQLRRWVPGRSLVVVADSSYAVLDLLARCAGLREPVTVITRLRLDAALYDPPPTRAARRRGRPALKGTRQPTLQQRLSDSQTLWQAVHVPWYGRSERAVEIASAPAIWYHTGMAPVGIRWVLIRDPTRQFPPQALLSTDPGADAAQIVAWFVRRWQLEVTFHEVRTHLGVETQRQWSDQAILRTTPALLGLFSVVTLCAKALLSDGSVPTRSTAWYTKSLPTFVDTLALVRLHLWPVAFSAMSSPQPEMVQIPRVLLDHLTETLASAA